jgi:hypothetical protein
MFYCGFCGAKLKPVSPQLREDILFVTREENKRLFARLRRQTFAAVSIGFAVLSFFGYSELRRIKTDVATTVQTEVASSVQNDIVPRIANEIRNSTAAQLREQVPRAVAEATTATLPEFRAAMRQSLQKHEADIAKAADRSKNEMRVRTELATQEIDEATKKTVSRVSTTTTTFSLPNSDSIPRPGFSDISAQDLAEWAKTSEQFRIPEIPRTRISLPAELDCLALSRGPDCLPGVTSPAIISLLPLDSTLAKRLDSLGFPILPLDSAVLNSRVSVSDLSDRTSGIVK